MCRSSVGEARRKEPQAERRAWAKSLKEEGVSLSRKRMNVWLQEKSRVGEKLGETNVRQDFESLLGPGKTHVQNFQVEEASTERAEASTQSHVRTARAYPTGPPGKSVRWEEPKTLPGFA